jgi:hypothetical protein
MQNAVTEREQEREEGQGQREEQVVVQLNATDLVWLAEAADGMRGVEFTLVRDKTGKARLRTELDEGDRPVTGVKVKTDSSLKKPGAKRIKVLDVTLRPENSEPITIDSGDGSDAVFWTESAIEKFLYPYYHAQRLWDEDLAKLKAAFELDERAVAIVHKAPSSSRTLEGRAKNTLKVGCVVRGPEGKPALKWEPLDDYLRSRPS